MYIYIYKYIYVLIHIYIYIYIYVHIYIIYANMVIGRLVRSYISVDFVGIPPR